MTHTPHISAYWHPESDTCPVCHMPANVYVITANPVEAIDLLREPLCWPCAVKLAKAILALDDGSEKYDLEAGE